MCSVFIIIVYVFAVDYIQVFIGQKTLLTCKS